MRLACPKCGAEYEVPEGLVPEGGKHVQCTDCDTRWFVRGGRDAVVSEDQLIERLENWRPRLVTGGPAAPEPRATGPAAPEPAPRPEPLRSGTEAAQEPDPETPRDPPPRDASSDHAPDPDWDPMPDLSDDGPPEDFVWEDSDGEVVVRDPVPPAIEPARPTPAPATPPAAPMFRPVPPPEPEAEPASGKVSETPAARTEAEPAAAPERAIVSETGADDADGRPVRERTRSSQRIALPEDGGFSTEPATAPLENGGFRTGLLVVLAFFALALGAYAGREAIVGTVPAAAPALDGYAGAVDGLRERIDRVIAPDG